MAPLSHDSMNQLRSSATGLVDGSRLHPPTNPARTNMDKTADFRPNNRLPTNFKKFFM
jgi:hypothetical protein